ncbi:hypothetical protein EV426DRAFT_160935 [Tirmania nivea]|nr:hypothetical protein EV426DRAFT_160935 [Tirmania nivea]
MENLQSETISAANSANDVQLELTAQEIKLSIDCLDRLAQALIQVHNFAEQLAIAEEIVAQCTTEYGITIEQRIRCQTPIDANNVQSYRSDGTIIERAIAASKVWEARTTLDKTLAHHAGREGRDLLLTIRNFQAKNLHTLEFNSLSSERKQESEPTATKKPQGFHRLKKASIASIRHYVSIIGAAAERKPMFSSPMLRTSPPDLAAITKETKAIEDAAISKAIGGLTEKIFLPMEDIIFQGNIVKNFDKYKQKQRAYDESVEQFGDHVRFAEDDITNSMDLESQNIPLASTFETGDLAYHEAINEAIVRRQDSMSAISTRANNGSSDSYSIGEYYDSDNIREDTAQNLNDKAYRRMGMAHEDIEAFKRGYPNPNIKKRGGGLTSGDCLII